MFDADKSGTIEFRRFMLVIMALSGGTPEENVEKIFYMVDTNNDGHISVDVVSDNMSFDVQKFYPSFRNTKM